MRTIYHRILNSKRMLERRRELRRKTTSSEDVLWKQLRKCRLGFRFKRQYSIVNYVVDFYCAPGRLAIEIDGSIHRKSKQYDNYRTQYLSALGVNEIRFSNEMVNSNTLDVLSEIKNHLPSPEIRRGRRG